MLNKTKSGKPIYRRMELFLTDSGNVRGEFVEYIGRGRRVEHSLDLKDGDGMTITSWTKEWSITGIVPTLARLTRFK